MKAEKREDIQEWETIQTIVHIPVRKKNKRNVGVMTSKVWDGENLGQSIALQPKIDGIRVKINRYGVFSSGGFPITSLKNELYGNWIDLLGAKHIDAEVWAGFGVSAAKVSGAVRNGKSSGPDLMLRVFDFCPTGEPLNAFARLRALDNVVADPYLLQWTKCDGKAKSIKKAHSSYVEQGYEGTMIKTGTYETKRSSNSLKHKTLLDATGAYIGIKVTASGAFVSAHFVGLSEGVSIHAWISGFDDYTKEMFLLGLGMGRQAKVSYPKIVDGQAPRATHMFFC